MKGGIEMTEKSRDYFTYYENVKRRKKELEKLGIKYKQTFKMKRVKIYILEYTLDKKKQEGV